METQENVNKKVIGAKKHFYDNINFDSAIEVSCYKHLKANNIPFEYNKTTIELIPSFRLSKVNFFHQKSNRNKTFIQVNTLKGEKEKIPSMTITPDFKILVNNYIIFIETKGFANDVYPYKRKLLLKILEEQEDSKGIYYFEPRSVKQIKESIEIIKRIIDEESRKDKTIIEESII